MSSQRHSDDDIEDAQKSERKSWGGSNITNGNYSVKEPLYQTGVLRTNCIDCLDRTNVAQYAYGLAALGKQLHALGVTDSPKIDLDAPLADDLMGFYERMGDTLAHQYGGSAAHNKVSLTFLLFSSCLQISKSENYFVWKDTHLQLFILIFKIHLFLCICYIYA